MGRKFLGGRPLVEPCIRTAPHGHFSVGPRLASQPLNDIVTVAAFIGHWLKAATGVPAAAHIHERVNVAVLCEIHSAVGIAVGDVRRESENDRERILLILGLEDSGVKLHAVAQGDLHAPEEVHTGCRLLRVRRRLLGEKQKWRQDKQEQWRCEIFPVRTVRHRMFSSSTNSSRIETCSITQIKTGSALRRPTSLTEFCRSKEKQLQEVRAEVSLTSEPDYFGWFTSRRSTFPIPPSGSEPDPRFWRAGPTPSKFLFRRLRLHSSFSEQIFRRAKDAIAENVGGRPGVQPADRSFRRRRFC